MREIIAVMVLIGTAYIGVLANLEVFEAIVLGFLGAIVFLLAVK